LSPPGGSAPVAARPGQTYFVPGVRVMRLGQLHPGSDKGDAKLIEEILPDILSVSVTRPCTGAAQFCIVLNNWYDTLPADRAAGFGAREGATGDTTTWPRFKYNDFKVLDFAMRLRIDMRYFPDPEKTLSQTEKDAQAWVPMISGPITDMRFTFTDREGARLEVCGEDDLCMLKNKNPKKHDYWAVSEVNVIKDVLKNANYPLQTIAPPCKPWPTFTESTGKALAEAHFEGQSYLDYLKKFAERWDFEVFIEHVSLDDPDSGVEFHFEPCRCRCRPAPDGVLKEIYLLERGKNLVEFNPTFHVVDQYTSVTVTGHDHSWKNPAMVSGTCPDPPPPEPPAEWKGPDPLADELHIDPAKNDEPLTSGPEWRRLKFGLNPNTEPNQRGLDKERATVMADASYRKRARQFLKIKCVTVGLPRLRAGRYVEIRGMNPPFDGFYYVEESTHTYGNDGLRTHFTARRPGAPFRGQRNGK
jgi:hypothetical protein